MRGFSLGYHRRSNPIGIRLIIVVTSCGTPDEADRIATALVSEGLAACAQIFAGQSVYRWEGRIERSGEWIVHAKTRDALAAAVEARIAELHSYQLPEIIRLAVEGGSAPYLAWVDAETQNRS